MVSFILFFLITDSKCSFKKSNGTVLTPEELFEFFGKMIQLIVSNMRYVDPIQQFIDSSSEFPYADLIELCPKFANDKSDFEDPIEFFQFMCTAMKPLRNKDDDVSPLAMCTVIVNSYYRCTKCETLWEERAEECHSVNLLTMLQKE